MKRKSKSNSKISYSKLRELNRKYEMRQKRKKMHEELLKKLQQKDTFFCHSNTKDLIEEYKKQGYIPHGSYVTVNRINEFGEENLCFTLIYDEDDEEEIYETFIEDPCLEGTQLVESEWLAHDQVILNIDADFYLNADILEIGNSEEESEK
jgi:hypothetical protein